MARSDYLLSPRVGWWTRFRLFFTRCLFASASAVDYASPDGDKTVTLTYHTLDGITYILDECHEEDAPHEARSHPLREAFEARAIFLPKKGA